MFQKFAQTYCQVWEPLTVIDFKTIYWDIIWNFVENTFVQVNVTVNVTI